MPRRECVGGFGLLTLGLHRAHVSVACIFFPLSVSSFGGLSLVSMSCAEGWARVSSTRTIRVVCAVCVDLFFVRVVIDVKSTG